MPRGGARPGAGRPATGRTTELIGFRLKKDLAARLKELAAKDNLSLSMYLARMLRQKLMPRPSRKGAALRSGKGVFSRRAAPKGDWPPRHQRGLEEQ